MIDESEPKMTNNITELTFLKAAIDEHAIVSIADIKGNITYVNDKFCEISGYDRDELIGKNHRMLKSDEHSTDFYKVLWKTISNGETWHGEIRNVKKNGESYWVKATIVPHLNEDGKPFEYASIRTDITQQKSLEVSLRKSEARLRLLFTTTTQGVVYQRVDGSISSANPAAEKILGLSLAQMQGKTSSDPRWKAVDANEEDFTGESHPSMVALGTGKSVIGVLMGVFIPEEEKYRWITVDAIPQFKEGDDKPFEVYTTFTDITKQRESELALLEAVDNAEKANKAKSNLLANMSHELRTPLNAIIGFSDSMKEETFGSVGSDKNKEYLEDINYSGQHLLELINDILDLSAFEQGALELNEANVDVSKVAEMAIRIIKPRADHGKVKVVFSIMAETPKIYADERRIKQVLLNLLSNAVKFTQEGGEVIASSWVNDDGSLSIAIIDTGYGMNDEEISIALSKFGQVDSGHDRKHEGTGLGLPLTKGLMELHGGTLEIESMKHHGTMVTATLPKERVIIH